MAMPSPPTAPATAPATSRRSQFSLELVWWLFTLLLATLVILPLYTTLLEFPFYVPNFVYVVVAVTLTRYLFFLHISWLRDRLFLQGAIIMALIPLLFYMGQRFQNFIIYFDEQGPDVLHRYLDPSIGPAMTQYVHAEYRFFGIWAMTAAVITPFRFLYNIWVRYRAGVRS